MFKQNYFLWQSSVLNSNVAYKRVAYKKNRVMKFCFLFIFQVRSSAELVFIDASSNMEENGLQVFILCTHTVCGALPLGIIVTSDQRTETITKALQMYKESLPVGCFYGNGEKGPSVFMTDNCPEERDALAVAWPGAVLILCIFHILQQVWRWLHEAKHGIEKDARPSLLVQFKSLVYCETSEQFDELLENLVTDQTIGQKYPKYIEYIRSLEDIKESWAICYRKDLLIRGHNTNNNAEAQFMVIKDIILQRVREYNVVSLFDKFVGEFNDYYKNKLLSVSSSNFDGFYSRRYFGKSKKDFQIGYKKPSQEELKRMEERLVDHGSDVYSVPSASSDQMYLVDINAGTCSCPVGANGAPCKHQYLLWVLRKGTGPNFLPVFSPEKCKMYAEIAIGGSLPVDAYVNIHETSDSLNIESDDIPTSSQNCNDENGSAPNTETGRIESTSDENTIPSNSSNELNMKRNEAKNSLSEVCDTIVRKIPHADSTYLDGIIKFARKFKAMSDSNASSAFHTFGSNVHRWKRLVNTATSIRKRAQKGKISVQPESVKRRVNKNGSRRATRKGKPSKPLSMEIPVKSTGTKRKHAFSKNVAQNQPVPKKAGRSMLSKTKVGRPKVHKTKCK